MFTEALFEIIKIWTLMLSEINQSQIYDFTFTWNLKNKTNKMKLNSDMENRFLVIRRDGCRNGCPEVHTPKYKINTSKGRKHICQ